MWSNLKDATGVVDGVPIVVFAVPAGVHDDFDVKNVQG